MRALVVFESMFGAWPASASASMAGLAIGDLGAAQTPAIVVGLITVVQVIALLRFVRAIERNDLRVTLRSESEVWSMERETTGESDRSSSSVDLYWIPLGAGQHVVRLSGKLFEAVSARVQRRRACDLYHSALVVAAAGSCFVIEQTPISDAHGDRRGVVLEGAVGSRLLGRFRPFRYEVRRWRDGVIPDIAEAVASPLRVADDLARASQLLDLVPSVPALAWGRDEGHTGDMWNSNSVISWLLARAGLDVDAIHPPAGGRAPGWHAGIELAVRTDRSLS
jgi:hypothetical protein